MAENKGQEDSNKHPFQRQQPEKDKDKDDNNSNNKMLLYTVETL